MSRTQDVRDLLGMRSRAAYLVVGLYALTCLVCALSTLDGVRTVWPVLLAVILCVAGSFVLLAAPGDPLPIGTSVALTAVGPLACGLIYAVIPTPPSSSLQTWPIGASVGIYTFMCVRGRTPFAWIGLASTIGVSLLWAVLSGQGFAYGLSLSGINIAPLLMATFFAYTIRPLGRSIFELRIQSTVRVAAEAAASAVLDERDEQLRRLDEQARPLLERIAAGPEIPTDERLVCELLEAELRDSLRARGLTDARLSRAARSARTRGVQVVLLDDRGDDALEPEIRTALASSVADRLDALEAGYATVRLLPAGRPHIASMLVDADRTYRIDYDDNGHPTTV